MIKIRRGLDLPLDGAPKQSVSNARQVQTVALLGPDYVGLKPTMLVQEGDSVKLGQTLFTDKKNPGVNYTSPAGGKILAINRGKKRVLHSVVIEIAATEEAVEFNRYTTEQLAGLSAEEVKQQLLASGLWANFRTRPFSKTPAIDAIPNSIFVTAIDTHPLAADPGIIISAEAEAFSAGLAVVSKLTQGKVYLCQKPGKDLPKPSLANLEVAEFSGVHPAGLVGTHIHFLDPVSQTKQVWHINYQQLIGVGKLFLTGKLATEKIIALAGPQVNEPRLVKTRLGANLDELLAGEVNAASNSQVISGSVFGGRAANGALAFLGHNHNQVSVLELGNTRHFLGWLTLGAPNSSRHSLTGIYLSSFLGLGKKFAPTTNTNGSERAMVPVGTYEKVMPLDILPTQLLRALIVGDIEQAMDLGCLELDEEDLALCTYACPGKYEYGPILRDNLTLIEKEA